MVCFYNGIKDTFASNTNFSTIIEKSKIMYEVNSKKVYYVSSMPSIIYGHCICFGMLYALTITAIQSFWSLYLPWMTLDKINWYLKHIRAEVSTRRLRIGWYIIDIGNGCWYNIEGRMKIYCFTTIRSNDIVKNINEPFTIVALLGVILLSINYKK